MSLPSIETPVVDASAWIGRDMQQDRSWIYTLTAGELAKISAALDIAKQRGSRIPELTSDDFPLPNLSKTFARLLDEIQQGRGFVLLRGMGALGLDEADLSLAYWGVGAYFGRPTGQNAKGDVLGHVRDEGRRFGGELDARGYHSNAHLEFHTDSSEIVGLLCVNPAKSGGASSLVSAVSIYNEALKHHPEYLPIYYRVFIYIKREAAFTDQPVTPHRLPIYGRSGDKVSCRYVRTRIHAAQTLTHEELSPLEIEALDFFDKTANDPDLRLDMDFQPGDIQLINNYTLLHSRTGFEDFDEPERRRHLLRLWLVCKRERELAESFPRYLGYAGQAAEVAYFADWKERQQQLAMS